MLRSRRDAPHEGAIRPEIGGERPTGHSCMTIQELVEEMNQFIEDDERKLHVGVAPSETTPALPAGRQVALQAASVVKRMRRRLDELEKRLSMAATRYFARAGK